jgi:hypothetical protein
MKPIKTSTKYTAKVHPRAIKGAPAAHEAESRHAAAVRQMPKKAKR